MDWFDIKNNPNVIVITEQVYRGIQCKYVQDKGWKIVLGMEEYLYPNFQEAKVAIDRIHEYAVQLGGAKLKTK